MPNLRELLHFYAEAGVDTPLEDAPVNRFAQADVKRPAAAPPAAARAPMPQPQPRQETTPPRQRSARLPFPTMLRSDWLGSLRQVL